MPHLFLPFPVSLSPPPSQPEAVMRGFDKRLQQLSQWSADNPGRFPQNGMIAPSPSLYKWLRYLRQAGREKGEEKAQANAVLPGCMEDRCEPSWSDASRVVPWICSNGGRLPSPTSHDAAQHLTFSRAAFQSLPPPPPTLIAYVRKFTPHLLPDHPTTPSSPTGLPVMRCVLV